MATRLVQNHSHWGAFLAEVEDDRVVGGQAVRARSRSLAADRGHPGGGAFGDPRRAADGARRLSRAWARRRGRTRARAVRAGVMGARARSGRGRACPRQARAWQRRHHGRLGRLGLGRDFSRSAHADAPLPRDLRRLRRPGSNYSFGSALKFLPHVLGSAQAVTGPLTSWSSIARHARLVVLFGGANPKNMQVAKGGCGVHAVGGWMRELARAGVEVVNISPIRDDGPQAAAAELAPDPAEYRHRDAARARAYADRGGVAR